MTIDRAALRTALEASAPWLLATEYGPRAVEAGRCDRCDEHPRLLPTCGPAAFRALCRDCAEVVGDDGWCEGHLDDGRRARAWAASLPARWGDHVVLWWVATGELRPGPGTALVAEPAQLPAQVRALLPARQP